MCHDVGCFLKIYSAMVGHEKGPLQELVADIDGYIDTLAPSSIVEEQVTTMLYVYAYPCYGCLTVPSFAFGLCYL